MTREDEIKDKLKEIKEAPVSTDKIVPNYPFPGITEIHSDISPIAERKRMIMNPNKEVALKIIERIYKCDGYCPCQPRDSTVDTRCPCPDFTGNGVCHCKLFVPAE